MFDDLPEELKEAVQNADRDELAALIRRWRKGRRISTFSVARKLYEKAEKLPEDASPDQKQPWQQRVSSLEGGRLIIDEKILGPLCNDQTFVEALRAEFDPVFKAERALDAISSPIAAQSEFAEKQQHFIRLNGYEYDLWFINAEHIPMFGDKDLEKTWIENILNGVTYHLAWDFRATGRGLSTRSTWRTHKTIIEDLEDTLEGRAGSASNSPMGKICYYIFHNSLVSDDQVLINDAIDWLSKDERGDFVELRIIFDLSKIDNADVLMLCNRFSFYGISTLAYVKRRSYLSNNRPISPDVIVHLEISNVAFAFGKSRGRGTRDVPERQHVFLGDPIDSTIGDLLVKFEEWVRKEGPTYDIRNR